MKSTIKYESDELEKIIRKRAIDNLIRFEHVYAFDVFNAGYVQALEDMNVDKEYISLFKRLCLKLRESFKALKPSYVD